MKKLIFTGIMAVAGLAGTMNAQIQKGNWLVGSSLISSNFGLNTGGGYNIAIQPKGAYFIEDNVAVGGYVDLGFNKVTNGSPTEFTYGVGALGRYFLSPGEKGVDNLLNHGRWFLEGNAGIGGRSVENADSTTGFDFGVGPGYSYFITPNIGLEGLVKYRGRAGFGSEGLNSNITFNLGFSIYLPTSKAKQIANDVK
ncbi:MULTISPECIES: hypothetical protein [Chryseobacterium]|uniref:Outer membrane protein beta-barrel domain-containing protein n=4 Tax=Chryseobacterium TaxID=59732 RepID=A0A3D9BEF0_9FLAO|nr:MULTISPECIES: hypothetical protein [Chryseobacterium]HAO08505.1 hypothetical protein [Chryseobacterium sp.]MBL7881234.1 hypothetical protein [Chryseobacterium gambrini]MCQ4141239.1 hypothetical protein [Chryseobacterium sp. EO14]MCY1663275.1 hypothetical protein [Chryseobacterium sp. SL1]MDO3425243.1 hypothetical protein [Chryseobacterium sp. APV1]